ncbi:MAG: pyrroline-5-carboxylate reductase [Paludibacteraceae bacterium]|nr:pyrroline-5-carboxylate reductase [Paludibacteraceae bacterium]
MKTVAIIGGGNMGGAIARALTQGSLVKQVKVGDINENTLRDLQNFNNNIIVSTDNTEIVKEADLVILAVKPWLIESVIETFKGVMDYKKQVFMSIAACVPFERLAAALEKDGEVPAMFRMIPNTAIDVLQSVSSISAHSNTTKEQIDEIMEIFGELGKAFLVPEGQLNAMMALSSCGIAYAFRYIRAAVEGGVEMGVYPEVAKQVVAQTLRGAIDLMETNDSHPEMEIDKVTTPGGTTIKGLNEMEANGFTNSVIKGLKASFIK